MRLPEEERFKIEAALEVLDGRSETYDRLVKLHGARLVEEIFKLSSAQLARVVLVAVLARRLRLREHRLSRAFSPSGRQACFV